MCAHLVLARAATHQAPDNDVAGRVRTEYGWHLAICRLSYQPDINQGEVFFKGQGDSYPSATLCSDILITVSVWVRK